MAKVKITNKEFVVIRNMKIIPEQQTFVEVKGDEYYVVEKHHPENNNIYDIELVVTKL